MPCGFWPNWDGDTREQKKAPHWGPVVSGLLGEDTLVRLPERRRVIPAPLLHPGLEPLAPGAELWIGLETDFGFVQAFELFFLRWPQAYGHLQDKPDDEACEGNECGDRDHADELGKEACTVIRDRHSHRAPDACQ